MSKILKYKEYLDNFKLEYKCKINENYMGDIFDIYDVYAAGWVTIGGIECIVVQGHEETKIFDMNKNVLFKMFTH